MIARWASLKQHKQHHVCQGLKNLGMARLDTKFFINIRSQSSQEQFESARSIVDVQRVGCTL